MRRSTPQPDDFDARRPRQAGLSRPRPPRVLISGDDTEDASEWEVVVVENEAIDDTQALEIARQRHEAQRRERLLNNLPSLDERDIAHALGLGKEGEAEAPDGIDSDAFVLPGDTPPARRIVGPAPLPVGLIFDGVDEPGDERPSRFATEDAAEFAQAGVDEIQFDEQQVEASAFVEPVFEDDAADPEVAAATDAADATTDGDTEAPAEEETAEASSWTPTPLDSRIPLDDLDHDFYDIGDEAIDAPVVGGEPVEAADDSDDGAGLVREDADVPGDDPHHSFYAVDDMDPATALEAPEAKPEVPKAPPTEPVKLWGTGRPKAAASDGKIYAPGEVPPEEVVAEEEDDDFASSFPIDPDEFLTEEGADVDVNELDYASVFGPVDAPPAAAPVPVAAPVHDVDPMEVAAHAPITESPARRRRRKAAAVGATAAGVIAKSRPAKADEADQFDDLKAPVEDDPFEDLQAIEADDAEWGWRDEFIDDDATVEAPGEQHPEHVHAAAGYHYAFDDDEFYEGAGPLLVDQRPRHIREDAEPRRGRRELLALGAAALVVLAVGVGSKVFSSADRPEFAETSDDPTTTVTRERITTSTTTNFGTGILTTVPEPEDTTVTTAGRPKTTTTVKRGSTPPPTTAPTTAPPQTTTTVEVTTTTEPTTTTSTEDTTPPEEPPAEEAEG